MLSEWSNLSYSYEIQALFYSNDSEIMLSE